MRTLWSLNEQSQKKLKEHGFTQTLGSEGGMYQSFEWSNEVFTIGLYYDRGYFDCCLMDLSKQLTSQRLIPLLRFIKKDPDFYAQELKKANLYNTLETNVYLGLVFDLYQEFVDFFESANEKLMLEKRKFDEANKNTTWQ